jgi:hypothetical protein
MPAQVVNVRPPTSAVRIWSLLPADLFWLSAPESSSGTALFLSVSDPGRSGVTGLSMGFWIYTVFTLHEIAQEGLFAQSRFTEPPKKQNIVPVEREYIRKNKSMHRFQKILMQNHVKEYFENRCKNSTPLLCNDRHRNLRD